MARELGPQPHLRLTLRDDRTLGRPSLMMNDGLDFCDADGNVICDLQHFLKGSTVTRMVGKPALVTLELYGVDVRRDE